VEHDLVVIPIGVDGMHTGLIFYRVKETD